MIGLLCFAALATLADPHDRWRTPLPDPELAAMRGGLRLPNGLDLALGIDIQTWIDGNLALHTVYASEGETAGIRVFTDGPNAPKTAPSTETTTSAGVVGVPLLVVDRSPTGTTIVPQSAVAGRTLNLVTGDQSNWLSGRGEEQVPVTPDGTPVQAPPGAIALVTDRSGSVVTLTTDMLEVRQLVGQATGVVVSNTGDNRAIDTVSSINVDLRGLSPTLLQGAFSQQRAALEAVLNR